MSARAHSYPHALLLREGKKDVGHKKLFVGTRSLRQPPVTKNALAAVPRSFDYH